MHAPESVRRFISTYYPRNHLYTAAGLGALLVATMLAPGVDGPVAQSQDAAPVSTSSTDRVSIPVTARDATVQPEPRPEFVLEDHSEQELITTREPQPGPQSLLEDQVSIDQTDPVNHPAWTTIEVKHGDNLSAIFNKIGLSSRDLQQVIDSGEEASVLNRLHPGYQLDFMISRQGQLEQLRVLKSPLEGHLFQRGESGFHIDPILRQARADTVFKTGTIADNMYMTGRREQVPISHLMQMADIFGGVIDFILDLRNGDRFSILYEEQYLGNRFVGHGEILAASFVNQGRVHTAVRYVNEAGEPGYYSPDGESMRRPFLRNPLDVFRISSNFNPRRRHPILNTIRAHKGIDYAAPVGTPILATRDGRVIRASRHGSFGNLVTIDHSDGFQTRYAHLSRFARGLGRGDRVQQGEVIGYVGATGAATGPHLHYEFLIDGIARDPRTVHERLPGTDSIDSASMSRFRNQTAPLLQQLATLNDWPTMTLNQSSAD